MVLDIPLYIVPVGLVTINGVKIEDKDESILPKVFMDQTVHRDNFKVDISVRLVVNAHNGLVLTRRKRNKLKHIEIRNMSPSALLVAWLNDKSAAYKNAVSNKDKVDHLLKDKKIDILGLSESNVLSDTEKRQLKIMINSFRDRDKQGHLCTLKMALSVLWEVI